MYTVFTRTWYKKDPKNPKNNIPNPGARRTKIDTARTEAEAREKCEKWNNAHNPGRFSRKAEYTSDF
jgi:hypothetical protein